MVFSFELVVINKPPDFPEMPIGDILPLGIRVSFRYKTKNFATKHCHFSANLRWGSLSRLNWQIS